MEPVGIRILGTIACNEIWICGQVGRLNVSPELVLVTEGCSSAANDSLAGYTSLIQI